MVAIIVIAVLELHLFCVTVNLIYSYVYSITFRLYNSHVVLNVDILTRKHKTFLYYSSIKVALKQSRYLWITFTETTPYKTRL